MKHILLFLTFLVAGCSATGPIYKPAVMPNDGSVRVYIYRPKAFSNSLISPGIKVNGSELVLLKNGGYTYTELESGKHVLDIKLSDDYSGGSKLEIFADENSEKFVKLITYNENLTGNMFRRVFKLVNVDKNVAETEIAQCRYIDTEKSKKHKKSIFVDN